MSTNILPQDIVTITDIDDDAIAEGLREASQTMRTRSGVRGAAQNIITNPAQIAAAQEAAINNPQLMRAAQRLQQQNPNAAASMSNKQNKQMRKYTTSRNPSQPQVPERISQKKVVLIDRTNGKRVLRPFPQVESFGNMEVLEVYQDIFIIHDLQLKKKNMYASQLTAHVDVTIYGDAYIYQRKDGQTIDTSLEMVNNLFTSLNKKQ